MDIPPPPDGYVMDQTAIPPPPDGYTLDPPRKGAKPVTVVGTVKAVGSGAASSALALAGGSHGDIREQGRRFVDTFLGDLVKGGLINKDQAAGVHNLARNVYQTLDPVESAMRAENQIVPLMQAATGQTPQSPNLHAPSTAEMQATTHTNYTPQNETERVAQVGGSMAVNALFPGSAASRLANVVVPTVGSEGARATVEALGGDQDAQQAASVAGAILGGAAAGLRGGTVAEPAETPTGIDPAITVEPKVAQAAASYAASRAANPDPAMVAAAESGKPVLAAEMMGTSGRTALGALARRAGETGDALGPALAERTAASPERMQTDFEAATGISPAAVQGDFEAMIDQRRSGPVREAYDAALAQKPNMEASGGGAVPLSRLMEEPEIRQAFGYAVRKLGSAAMADGQPTAEALDLTKKFLGKMVKRDPLTRQPINSGPDGIGNQFTLDNERALTAALREAIPGYGEALSQAGDYLSLQRAHESGDLILNPKVTVRDVEALVAKMSDAEREAYKGGVANRLFQMSENGRLTPKAVSTPAATGKLKAALGNDAADQFLTGAAQEKLLTDQARRMSPGINSPTAEFNAEMAAQDQAHPLAKASAEIAKDTVTATVATLGNVPIAIKVAILRQIAKGLGNTIKGISTGTLAMPEAVRNEAGRILMSEMTPEQVRSYAKLTGAQQDRAIKILVLRPEVLSRPAFLARAALGISAAQQRQQQERQSIH